jgi:cobalamin-dependent methionine synthase I
MEAVIKSGMREEDIIFDPLVMTVGADDQAAQITLVTVKRLRAVSFPITELLEAPATLVLACLTAQPYMQVS